MGNTSKPAYLYNYLIGQLCGSSVNHENHIDTGQELQVMFTSK